MNAQHRMNSDDRDARYDKDYYVNSCLSPFRYSRAKSSTRGEGLDRWALQPTWAFPQDFPTKGFSLTNILLLGNYHEIPI
jgi:hypothetical protein